MIKDGLNKRLKVTADGILIPNSLWISGKYYIIKKEDDEIDEKKYLLVQFSIYDKPVTRKGYMGSVSVTIRHDIELKLGEYVLKPDEETEKKIRANSFCIVDTSIQVEKTADLKGKYYFRLYKYLLTRTVNCTSKKYPDIKDLVDIKLSDILALRGISKSGVYFIRMMLDDMGISFTDDVFPNGDLQRLKNNKSEQWILI